MKRLLCLAALAALALAPAFAQQNRFSATTGDASLSAAATTLTIQKPATNGKNVVLESVTIYCSVACNVSQAVNGTGATATAATVAAIPPNTQQLQTATAWTASNVGNGTAIGGIVHLPSAGTQPIDVSKITLNGAGTGANYSVTIAAITGVANITIIWSEAQ